MYIIYIYMYHVMYINVIISMYKISVRKLFLQTYLCAGDLCLFLDKVAKSPLRRNLAIGIKYKNFSRGGESLSKLNVRKKYKLYL